jgi:hypothetical protein
MRELLASSGGLSIGGSLSGLLSLDEAIIDKRQPTPSISIQAGKLVQTYAA